MCLANELHGAEYFLRSSQVLKRKKKKLHFREFEGSLLHSKVPAPVPILNQITLFHASQSNLLKIYFIIVLPPMPRSYMWSSSFRLSHQNSVRTSPVPHMCQLPPPSYSSQFDRIIDEEYISKSASLRILLHSPITSPLSEPNLFPSILLSNTLSRFPPSVCKTSAMSLTKDNIFGRF